MKLYHMEKIMIISQKVYEKAEKHTQQQNKVIIGNRRQREVIKGNP